MINLHPSGVFFVIIVAMKIADYCTKFPAELAGSPQEAAWEVVGQLSERLAQYIGTLGADYSVKDGVAKHKTADIDSTAQIQAPAVIGPSCFVGPNSMLRGGVYMGEGSTIGFACEVKSSVICSGAAVAHLNYVGDSIIGSGVELEAEAQGDE